MAAPSNNVASLAARTSTAAPSLGIDRDPLVWPGAKPDELRVAPDGMPARVVKAHNAHKAHFISRYAFTLAVAMRNVVLRSTWW